LVEIRKEHQRIGLRQTFEPRELSVSGGGFALIPFDSSEEKGSYQSAWAKSLKTLFGSPVLESPLRINLWRRKYPLLWLEEWLKKLFVGQKCGLFGNVEASEAEIELIFAGLLRHLKRTLAD
jgi:hypothetical protein